MRGLARSPGRMHHNILQLGLLICVFLSQLSASPTDAATTHYSNGRRMSLDTAELEGSIARYRQLLNPEQFALRNLLQEGKEKNHHHQEVDNLTKIAEQELNEQKILNEKQGSQEEQQVSNDGKMEETEDNREQKVWEEGKTEGKRQQQRQDENKQNNAVEEEKKEEPLVLPEPYLLGPTIKDWDEQRESWLNANPKLRTTPDGKPRVLIVTGSQPEPCHSSKGDNFHIKSLKLKMDYARMHNYEIYYNLVWLDPLFDSFWVKLPTIRALMLAHPEIEWFFWVDSDAIFTDMIFEAPWKTYDACNMIMWGMNDYFYEEKHWTSYNAGVFMIRNCQWTLDLIDKWSPMGPRGPVRDAYGKVLSGVLKGRNEWSADDQSALAYLMITDEAVKAKVKLVDSPEYMISRWWVLIVDTFEDLMEKYHPGLGDHRWPWITHFTGCGPCYHSDDDTPGAKTCMKGIDRALNFADNQVLALMGFQHQSLSSPKLFRLRNETDRPLELGVNPWANRIAELARSDTS